MQYFAYFPVNWMKLRFFFWHTCLNFGFDFDPCFLLSFIFASWLLIFRSNEFLRELYQTTTTAKLTILLGLSSLWAVYVKPQPH